MSYPHKEKPDLKKSLSLTTGLLVCFILSFISLSTPGSAEPELEFGLAMHGKPKHNSQSQSLEYVNKNAPKGGDITYAAIGSFDSLNPYAIKGNPAQGLHLIYDRLMGRAWDEPFTLYPLIAKGYEIAPDRSWITFHLNPAASFSDSTPITADDVLFSYKTLREHGRPNMRRIYGLVKKVTFPKENAIRFDFKPGYDQETALIFAIMPVLSRKFWEDREFDQSLLKQPPSSGPYQITSLDVGKTITYQRNPDYWGKDLFINRGLYNFETITYDYFRNKNVAFQSVLAGEISFWREDDAGRWSRGIEEGFGENLLAKSFSHKRTERVKALIFNTRRPPFDKREVRQALSMVFNAGWINQTLYHNKYYRINSYYPNSELAAKGLPSDEELQILAPWKDELPGEVFGPAYQPAANTNRRELRINMREAGKILEKSGWVIREGRRVHEDTGKVFEFEIILNDINQQKIGLALKRNLERIGINVNLRMLDSAAFTGRLNEYNYDMVLHYWHSTLSPGTEQILFWGCLAAKEQARWNYAGICHPAIDSISHAIATSETRKELISHTRALDRVLTHGHYIIPLFYRGEDWVIYDSRLKYPEYTPVYGLVQESWWQNSKN